MGYLREYQIGVARLIGSPHPAHDGITFCLWRSSGLKGQIRLWTRLAVWPGR